jgi:hypothetical protein
LDTLTHPVVEEMFYVCVCLCAGLDSTSHHAVVVGDFLFRIHDIAHGHHFSHRITFDDYEVLAFYSKSRGLDTLRLSLVWVCMYARTRWT